MQILLCNFAIITYFKLQNDNCLAAYFWEEPTHTVLHAVYCTTPGGEILMYGIW